MQGDLYTFNQDNVNTAPETAGVYALYDGAALIYYGRAQGGSVTIRTRLQAHFRGDEGPCTRGAGTYRRETCSNPVAREKELLEAFERANGQLPRCNSRIG